jgi:hypothetical protein
MTDLPTPDEVEADKARGNMVAGLARQHYESLRAQGFNDEEAWELTTNYHWNLISGEDD